MVAGRPGSARGVHFEASLNDGCKPPRAAPSHASLAHIASEQSVVSLSGQWSCRAGAERASWRLSSDCAPMFASPWIAPWFSLTAVPEEPIMGPPISHVAAKISVVQMSRVRAKPANLRCRSDHSVSPVIANTVNMAVYKE